MALHAQGQGFQAQIQQECVLGAGLRAQIPHEMGAGLGDIRGFAELLRVDNAVIRLIGLGEHGELAVLPIKIAAVHNNAPQLHGVAVHIFAGGVGDNIRTEFEGPAVDGGGEGVVHNQGHAVGVGLLSKHLDIRDHQGRVGEGFGKHAAGVGLERRFQLFPGAARAHKGGLDAHFLHGLVNQVEGAAVNGAGSHHMVAGVADVQHGNQGSRLAGRGEHSAHAAFQGSNLLFHSVHGGVAQTGIEEALGLQVKEVAHGLGAVIGIRCALHNGHHPGLPVAGMIAFLDALGINAVIAHIHHSFA